MKSPEEHALSSFDDVGSRSIPEVLDSVGSSQRFAVKESLVHFYISDKSVLQRKSSFFCFKNSKVQSVVDQIPRT